MATASQAPPGQLQIPAWLQNSVAEKTATRTTRPSPISGGRRERNPSSAAGPQGTDQRTKKPRGGKASANNLGQQSQQINIFSGDDDFQPTVRQQQRPIRTSSNAGRAQPSRGGRNDKLFAKSDLNFHQRMRLLESAVLITMTHTSDRPIPLAVQTEGTNYHKLTFGQSGHKHGPPGPWHITRCAIAAYEAASTENDKLHIKDFVEQFSTPPPIPQNIIDENVAKYPTKTPAEVLARMTALVAANTRTRISQGI